MNALPFSCYYDLPLSYLSSFQGGGSATNVPTKKATMTVVKIIVVMCFPHLVVKLWSPLLRKNKDFTSP